MAQLIVIYIISIKISLCNVIIYGAELLENKGFYYYFYGVLITLHNVIKLPSVIFNWNDITNYKLSHIIFDSYLISVFVCYDIIRAYSSRITRYKVKCSLFQTYCTNMYSCQLWFISTKSSLIKISTSYNSVLRQFLCISKP